MKRETERKLVLWISTLFFGTFPPAVAWWSGAHSIPLIVGLGLGGAMFGFLLARYEWFRILTCMLGWFLD